MTQSVPQTLKGILPFLRRAEELDRDQTRNEFKLISFYCRQYAMELGIKLRQNDTAPETTEFLLQLMDQLEREKASIPQLSQEEAKETCLNFALDVFGKAEEEDELGISTKDTARTFYAAGTFFELLNQFGDVSEEIVEKRKYCKYRAAKILKDIKDGVLQNPQMSEVATEHNDSMRVQEASNKEVDRKIANSSTKANEDHDAELYAKINARPSSIENTAPKSDYTCDVKQHDRDITKRTAMSRVPQSQIDDAMELAKFAIAALKIKDITLASKRLKEALRCIT